MKIVAEPKERKPRRHLSVSDKRAELVARIDRCHADLNKYAQDLIAFDRAVREKAAALLAELPQE